MGAGNPTMPALDNDQASAIQNTIHEMTGVLFKPHDVDENDDPTHATHITMWEHRIKTLLAGMVQGKVIDLGGLNIGAFAIHYEIGGTAYAFAGETSTGLDASDVHYIYLDTDETLQVSDTAFPADSFHLAYAETSADDITTLEDRRFENADRGGTNLWSNVAAVSDVDLDDNELTNALGIDFTAPTELTISGGEITRTQFLHTVDTEGDAASDDLDTIATPVGEYRLLLIWPEWPDRVVVVKNGTGNIYLRDGEYSMNNTYGDMLLLLYVPYDGWHEITRSHAALAALLEALDCAGFKLENVGALDFEDATPVTISGGIATITDKSNITLTPQTGNTDDLDQLNGAGDSRLIILRAASADYTITVKHGTYIKLLNERDFDLAGVDARMVLLADGESAPRELCRNPLSINDLIETAKSVPYPITIHISGALAAGVQVVYVYVPYDITIINGTGYVVTAPSGGSCIVDIQDDGASIFANEGEMINIADGTHQATSATKNHPVAAGSLLRVEIKSTGTSPNGAEDLTLSIKAHVAPQEEP